jgi:2,4-diaminopentanoate dehydrogenase
VRFVVVGSGLIAAEVVACSLAKGDELVAAVDIDEAKIGRPVRDVLGVGPEELPVVASVDDAGTAEVAYVATGSKLAAVESQILACVASGMNVVSTCEELAYPWRTHAAPAERIAEAARAAGVTVLGTGINPGFAMDLFALVASTPCWRVRRVSVTRVLDAAKRRTSFQTKVGVGMSTSDFETAKAAGLMGHVGLAESAWMLSDTLGLGGRTLEGTVEAVLRKDERRDGGGVLDGMRERALLRDEAGEVVVALELAMFAGAETPVDRIELDADPPLQIVVEGGFPGDASTAGVVVNAAHRIRASSSGLLTMVDLAVPYAAASSA